MGLFEFLIAGKKSEKKSLYHKLFLTLTISFLLGCLTNAQESNIEENNVQDNNAQDSNASLQIYYTSNYIFRDAAANFQAIQPSGNYNFKNTGLSFLLWTSFELDYQTQNIEINPMISYSHTFKNNIGLGVGVVYYLVALPGEVEGQNLTEFFGSFSPAFLPLSPVITFYYSDTGYLYGTIAISQSLTKKENGISIYGWMGYRNGVEGEKNGIKELVSGVNIPIKIRSFSFSINGILTHLPHAVGKDTYGSVGITVNLN